MSLAHSDSFQQTGLYPRGEPFDDEPFNRPDLDNLKTTMGRIYIYIYILSALSRSMFSVMMISQSAPA